MASPCSPSDLASPHGSYSRKQKSLGLLCTNFVGLYDREDIESISLDDAAEQLGVERRRIYDIVNVLESVGILARKAKKRYSWIGFGAVPKALEDLKAEALNEMSSPLTPDSSRQFFEDDEDRKLIGRNEDLGEEKPRQAMSGALSYSAYLRARSVVDPRKEKSLGLLTQNFVKMFLTTDADMVSLDEAARLLLGDGLDSAAMKTKVRRLYDIANVLASVNLIEKTQQAETRKPAFRWLGIKGNLDNGHPAIAADQSRKRPFGTDITNAECKRFKTSSLVDKKPSKVKVRADDLKECNLTAQKQLQGPKGYVFGPFCPSETTKGGNDKEKGEKEAQDWESLAASNRLKYHNEALTELFAHYMDAWKSWYVKVAEGGNTLEQPYKSIVDQMS